MRPNKKLPLFIITGASCVGKTTLSEILFRRESKYIVLDSDLLWTDIYNTPEDEYRRFRELWLRLNSNISQIGMPVVLCGCAIPKQFEECVGRSAFTTLYYLAVICDDETLEYRMRNGRRVTDINWINSSLDFNNWLKKNASETKPNIKLLDNTNLTPAESAEIVDEWIKECMRMELENLEE